MIAITIRYICMFNTEINNPKIFDLLFQAAKTAETVKTSRHASCILYKNRVLAVGRNLRKTHPMASKYNGDAKPCIHSELDVIVKVINMHGAAILKRCDLYNLRITNTNKIGLAKPCEGCSKLISAFGIKRTFYT